jgi:hypothetical protein
MPFFLQKIKFFPLILLFFCFGGSFLLYSFTAQGADTVLNVSVFFPECDDNIDNDSDTFIDFPLDVSCFSLTDNYEGYHPQCADMVDNDSDGLTDSADPQCHTDGNVGNSASYNPDTDLEATAFQCNDSADNDSDGLIDYPDDPGCSSLSDNSETSSGGPPPGDTTPPYIVSFTPENTGTGVASSTVVSITFDNTIHTQSGTILIKESLSNNIFDSIDVSGPRVTLTAGRILTIAPVSNFVGGTSYYIELPADMARDDAGNSFIGLLGSSDWEFTTEDKTPPVITGIDISIETGSATVSWNTDEPATSVYLWGTNTQYADGSGTDPFLATTHVVVLDSLLSETTYYYIIYARDESDNVSTHTGFFSTPNEEDITPPANPSDFVADSDVNFITLTWINPDDEDFDFVKIQRSDDSFPLSPTDGDFVYEGTGVQTEDPGLILGVTYYYTIFARDTSGNYSSGALASAEIPFIEPPIEPTIIPPITPPIVPPSGGGETTTPLVVPPQITPPVATTTEEEITASPEGLFPLHFSDFDFFEQREIEKKIIPKNDTVLLDSNKNTRISIATKKLPPESNAVILRIQELDSGKEESPFLLSKEGEEFSRGAVIDLRGAKGRYPVIIDVFGKDEKLLARVLGVFDLAPKSAPLLDIFSPLATEQITSITENISPTALPVGIAIGVSQSIVLATNISSFYDVYLLLLKFIGLLSGFFRRKKSEPWGVVYDSVTKQPIDPAYVVMEDTKGEKKKKTAITDLDGRYGFLVEPGTYSIVANKTHYKFPSDILANKKRDEMYDNLYFGMPFETEENKVIRYNIPLDPVEFDWNEFAKNKDRIFNLYSRKEKIRAFIFNVLFFFGFSVSVVATIFSPTRLNLFLFGFYTIIMVFQTLWKYKHKITRLFGKDGIPMSFAIVSADVSGLAIPVTKKVTTDMLGRFYLLTPPGKYDIKVQEKQADGSYKEVYKKVEVDLKNGVLAEDIVIE